VGVLNIDSNQVCVLGVGRVLHYVLRPSRTFLAALALQVQAYANLQGSDEADELIVKRDALTLMQPWPHKRN